MSLKGYVKGSVGPVIVAQLTFVVYFLVPHFIGSSYAVLTESVCIEKLRTI